MSSGLEIRICTLKEVVSSGEGQSLGAINPHADGADDLAAKIVALEFEGAHIKSDLTDLRRSVLQLLGAGFPGDSVLVIGPAGGLDADTLDLAAERALAVKDFLLALGVPARHVAADMASAYLRPTRAG
jgi:hypothetical protein